MPEVAYGKAAGACGCGEVVSEVGEEDGEEGFAGKVVSEVGEEDGEEGFAGKVNNYGLLGYGCIRNS